MKVISIVLFSVNAISVASFAPVSSTTPTPIVQSNTQLYNDLWGEPPNKEGETKDMSKSLPFAPRPKLLDGTLPGDVGFEYVL